MNKQEILLIKDAVVITLDDDLTIYEKGFVVSQGNKIVYVGDGRDIPDAYKKPDKVIDGSGKLLLPGLVDLHYHSAPGRGFFEDLPLEESLMGYWYPMIRMISPEDAYWAAMASYGESIKYGTTSVNDMWRRMISCSEAAEKIGIRATLCCDVANPDEGLDTVEDNIRLVQAKNGAADGRIDTAFGLEWMPLAGPDILFALRENADKYGVKLHVHLNESQDEVNTSLRMFGRRPVELAYDCGVLGPDCIAAHCVWLTHHEMNMLRVSETSVSHNPVSNCKLGNGPAFIPELMHYGVNVGLGHDDAMSGMSRDIFNVMKFASLLHRATRADANLLNSRTMLKMATVNGNKALHHDGGSIEVGKNADMILMNLHNEHFVPLVFGNDTNIYDHLVYSAKGSDVDTSVIDGKVVMENRVLCNVDEHEVRAKTRELFKRILNTVSQI